jgi:hypothetical protein
MQHGIKNSNWHLLSITMIYRLRVHHTTPLLLFALIFRNQEYTTLKKINTNHKARKTTYTTGWCNNCRGHYARRAYQQNYLQKTKFLREFGLKNMHY